MDHVFHISAEGQIETLYTEELPLFALGAATIKRASEIEFNNGRGFWEVKIAGQVVYDGKSREECLQWERSHFNAALLAK